MSTLIKNFTLVLVIATIVSCTSKEEPSKKVASRSLGTVTHAPSKCVRIYYDEPTTLYRGGRAHAMYLQNLIGHFKNIQQIALPIEKYKKGDLTAPYESFGKCAANFYIGTYYDNKLPKDFIEDYIQSDVPTVWYGYNIWQLSDEHLKKLWNVEYKEITRGNPTLVDESGLPGFYRYFKYKGEVFYKAADRDPSNPDLLNAADELIELTLLDKSAASYVVSWAEHSAKKKQGNLIPSPIPYVYRNKAHWYFADSPFIGTHKSDRYLIASDLLFDILDEAPLYPGTRPALIRFEDLHAEIPQWELDGLLEMSKRMKIHFLMSVIPEYVGGNGRVKLGDKASFRDWLVEAEKQGGATLMHGWTHQHDDIPNPKGVSGWDYEFWDSKTNRPLEKDSIALVLERLEKGYKLFEDEGITPVAWLTPHYMASSLDNFVFGQVFDWSVGGVYMAPYKTNGVKLSGKNNFDVAGKYGKEERLRVLTEVKFDQLKGAAENLFISPFEIYGDVYGQGILPETAGYLNPNPKSPEKNSVDDMLRVLKRNRVIRDAWASYFIHPFMLNVPAVGGVAREQGDTAELERLIQGTKNLGYEFVDLKAWMQTAGRHKRAETIDVIRP